MAKKVKEPKEKHTLRTVLIVIAVILIIGIIGGSMDGNDDEEKETEVITESAVITEAVTGTVAEPITEVFTGQDTNNAEVPENAASKDILDHITNFKYDGIDDSSGKPYMFWSVYLDDEIKTYWYDNDDFVEVALACMQQPETKENEAEGYAIDVYDSEGQVIFMWDSYDDKYTITQFDWSSSQTNPNRSEWELSVKDYNDIMNAKTED